MGKGPRRRDATGRPELVRYFLAGRFVTCRTGVIFSRILAEQGRKRGERETRVAHEERSTKKYTKRKLIANPRFKVQGSFISHYLHKVNIGRKV